MTDDDAKVKARARALIQGYIGPDHKVIEMNAFYSALWCFLCRPQTTLHVRLAG